MVRLEEGVDDDLFGLKIVQINYGDTRITIRPGEPDEWSMDHPFKVLPENPVSKAEQAYYDRQNKPRVDCSLSSLGHVPSNTVVIEFMA